MSANEWLAAKNILVVRLDNIGDVIMLGPALRAVKETSPQARLTLLANPAGATAASLLPWIDDVIPWRPVWQDVGNRILFDPVRERQLTVAISEAARQTLPKLLARVNLDPQQPYLLLHPGASALARRYSVERFGVIARVLTRRGWSVLVTGVEREGALLEEITAHAPMHIACLVEPPWQSTRPS